MRVTPADQVIDDTEAFRSTALKAFDYAAAIGVSYDGAAIANSRRSVLNYVGIRYKK